MKILLAYDGSENAKRALARAVELSKASDADFAIVHYVDLEAFETFAAKHLLAELRRKTADDAEKLVAGAALIARQGGVTRVRSLVLQDGDPAHAILSAAEGDSADLIVVGRSGVRRFERFFLG